MKQFLLVFKSFSDKTGKINIRVPNFILAIAVILGFWSIGQVTRNPSKDVYANIMQIAYMPLWLTSAANNYCEPFCYTITSMSTMCWDDRSNAENYYNVDCDCAEDCYTDVLTGRCPSNTTMMPVGNYTEWGWFEHYFPDTNNPADIIGECDDSYICYGYAKNPSNPDTTRPDYCDSSDPLDGQPTFDDLDCYYSGYSRTTNPNQPGIVIRIYTDGSGNPTHADRVVGGGVYRSKLGDFFLIEHGASELVPEYGNVTHYYYQ